LKADEVQGEGTKWKQKMSRGLEEKKKKKKTKKAHEGSGKLEGRTKRKKTGKRVIENISSQRPRPSHKRGQNKGEKLPNSLRKEEGKHRTTLMRLKKSVRVNKDGHPARNAGKSNLQGKKGYGPMGKF